MVFSNPEVVRRVNEEYIPVALKAAHVNNPPPGIEGALYAEIARSKPAPQGICTANSAGKVLAWALSFDDDKSILEFLDHVARRYRQSADAEKPVTAERFRKFPSRKLADVEDTGKRARTPGSHAEDDRCPAAPALEEGTLVGRIIGRALDKDGKPVVDTTRQEHYMEARLQIRVPVQEEFALAASRAGGKRFRVPHELASGLVSEAFLGQLDVNPSGGVPGSQNDHREWEFWGQQVDVTGDTDTVRVRIEGKSNVAGGQDTRGNRRRDGRVWEHRVKLQWRGFVDIEDQRVARLVMVAGGDERLRWGNARFKLSLESDAEHLMAGHPIDLECKVRYGLFAEPCSPDEVAKDAVARGSRRGDPRADRRAIQAKMRRLQAGMRRLRRSGGDASEVAKLMREFGPLMEKRRFQQAESILDEALKLLEKGD